MLLRNLSLALKARTLKRLFSRRADHTHRNFFEPWFGLPLKVPLPVRQRDGALQSQSSLTSHGREICGRLDSLKKMRGEWIKDC